MQTAALIDRTHATAARTVPVTVAVGHSSSLVSAGLAATLARTPGCQISLRQISPAECNWPSAHPADLVFGDTHMLRCVQAQAKASPGTCKFAKAKLVLVAGGDERSESSKVRADERVSLECREQELFATVR